MAHGGQSNSVQRRNNVHAGATHTFKLFPARSVQHQVRHCVRAESERDIDAPVVVDVHLNLAPAVSRALPDHGEHLRCVGLIDVDRSAEAVRGGDLHADKVLDVRVFAIQGVDVIRRGRRTPARRPVIRERGAIHVAARIVKCGAERHDPWADAPGGQIRPDFAQRIRCDRGVEQGRHAIGHMRAQMAMHECTAGFGVVLAIRGPWYCLEMHLALAVCGADQLPPACVTTGEPLSD